MSCMIHGRKLQKGIPQTESSGSFYIQCWNYDGGYAYDGWCDSDTLTMDQAIADCLEGAMLTNVNRNK